MLQRKIVSASITGALFAILLGFIMPYPFGEQVVEQNYLYSATTAINGYLMYSFPVILLYGTFASFVSDKVAVYLMNKSENKKIEMFICGVLHIIFGLVFLPYSLVASIMFFVIDQLLQKRKTSFHSLQALKSLLIPLTV